MDDLQKEYSLLFNGITDTIKTLENMSQKLKRLQQQAEELYLEHTRLQETKEAESNKLKDNLVILGEDMPLVK